MGFLLAVAPPTLRRSPNRSFAPGGGAQGQPEFVRAVGAAAPGFTATAAGLDAVQTAASAVTNGIDGTVGGIDAVRAAADGAQGALVAKVSGLSSMGLPGGAKATGEGAPTGGGAGAPSPASSAVPGRQGSYAPPPRFGQVIQLTTTSNMDDRPQAKQASWHSVAMDDTRNRFADRKANGLQTSIGIRAPVIA